MPYNNEEVAEFNVGDIVTVIDYDKNFAWNSEWVVSFAPEYFKRYRERKEPVATPYLNGDIGEVVASSKRSLGAKWSASLIDFGDTIRLIDNHGLKKVEHIIKVS